MSADEDLKLSDLLKYYLRESQAAKVTLLFIVFLDGQFCKKTFLLTVVRLKIIKDDLSLDFKLCFQE